MSELLASASRVAGLELELRTDTQFATVYLDGRPVGTARRRHACDPRSDPPWKLWLAQHPDPLPLHGAASVVRWAEMWGRRVRQGMGEADAASALVAYLTTGAPMPGPADGPA